MTPEFVNININVAFPAELLRRIDAAAKASCTSRAEYIRSIMRAELNKQTAPVSIQPERKTPINTKPPAPVEEPDSSTTMDKELEDFLRAYHAGELD